MNRARLWSGLLAACACASLSCATAPGPVLVFTNRNAIPPGAKVTVRIVDSDYSELFTPATLPRTLRLRVDSQGKPFTLVIIIEVGTDTAPCVSNVVIYPGQSETIRIDFASLIALCVAGSHPIGDGGDASGDARDPGADGGDGGDGSDGKDAPSNDGGVSGPCVAYCEEMSVACPEAYASGDCSALCAAFHWPTGETGDRGRNTVACRMTWATLAGSATTEPDRKRLCLAAGASGSNTCGSLCENYCAASALACPGLLGGNAVDDCIRSGCRGPVPATEPAISSGNTLDCRIYWIGRAATDASLCSWGDLAPQQGSPCVDR